ncbi:hypothetical protein LIG30_0133 [Burkholderia sp. lig30]|jgi:hypothetical protein|uniref:hypothetical protein n=1 Tax=Burkholderia sp. lig30 TaxID=1192124 RepID=UPI000461A49F|nr:hypothetical protein [Burkholderia sp. lig30]KDB09040.1 hypothetical protein LIG30_0133 [Burkholderia sp. lig30]
MLRWLIAVLFLANMLAFLAARGLFGPSPAAGARDPGLLSRQVMPGSLRVTPLARGADQAAGNTPDAAPASASALPAASAPAP